MATNPIIEHWEVTSTTDESKSYTVSKRQDGTYSCDCPHWKFHKAPKPVCKHQLALRVDRLFGSVPEKPRAEEILRPTHEDIARIDALLGGKKPVTPTPPAAQQETFTVSVLQNPRRKFRADL